MEKSAGAFRTISEVADELSVPKHVLRFWEGKFGQIKPMKRGGGRRYYRPEDVELLRGIRKLLHDEGYTIKGVQKVIRESGIDFVKQNGFEALESGPVATPAVKPGGRLAAVGSAKPDAKPGKSPSRRVVAASSLDREQTTLLLQIKRELQACLTVLDRFE